MASLLNENNLQNGDSKGGSTRPLDGDYNSEIEQVNDVDPVFAGYTVPPLKHWTVFHKAFI